MIAAVAPQPSLAARQAGLAVRPIEGIEPEVPELHALVAGLDLGHREHQGLVLFQAPSSHGGDLTFQALATGCAGRHHVVVPAEQTNPVDEVEPELPRVGNCFASGPDPLGHLGHLGVRTRLALTAYADDLEPPSALRLPVGVRPAHQQQLPAFSAIEPIPLAGRGPDTNFETAIFGHAKLVGRDRGQALQAPLYPGRTLVDLEDHVRRRAPDAADDVLGPRSNPSRLVEVVGVDQSGVGRFWILRPKGRKVGIREDFPARLGEEDFGQVAAAVGVLTIRAGGIGILADLRRPMQAIPHGAERCPGLACLLGGRLARGLASHREYHGDDRPGYPLSVEESANHCHAFLFAHLLPFS